MKSFLFPAIVAGTLALTGCCKKEAPFTEDQKAAVAQEALQAMRVDLAIWTRLDNEAGWKTMEDSPGFSLGEPDGSLLDKEAFRRMWTAASADLKGFRIIPKKENCLALAANLAVYTQTGAWELEKKDGSVTRFEPMAVTYVMRKTDGTWKLAYGHESSAPPTVSKGEAPAPKK